MCYIVLLQKCLYAFQGSSAKNTIKTLHMRNYGKRRWIQYNTSHPDGLPASHTPTVTDTVSCFFVYIPYSRICGTDAE